MSYRDDDLARDERANALIDEIAKLEREKIAAAAGERRLDEAKRELATLQLTSAAVTVAPPAPAEPEPPSLAAHVLAFCGAAGAAFLGYTLFV